MAGEIEFVNGLIVKAPHERAPDFVKASISINVKELSAWLSGRSDEWVNIDVKESRGGKWYASVSTFKPRQDKDVAGQSVSTTKSAQRKSSEDSDVPF